MPKLIYFKSRGRAEVIRLTCAEAGVKYEEEGFEPAEFPAMKASGRLPYLAAPVWEEDDGWRLAQSYAIARHIARGHGLHGTTAREQAEVDEVVDAAEDVRNEYRKLMGAEPAKRPEVRANLLGNVLPRWFGALEKRLPGDWFVAGHVTVADLAIWYVLEMAKDNGFGPALGDCPKLNAFYDRVAARPKIAAYLASAARRPLLKMPV